MYDLLIAKCEQCPLFKTALLESGEDEIIEDTNHEYWARGLNAQGPNMLGKLQMTVSDGLKDSHSLAGSEFEYRPSENGSMHPCFMCSEGNHNSLTCPTRCLYNQVS